MDTHRYTLIRAGLPPTECTEHLGDKETFVSDLVQTRLDVTCIRAAQRKVRDAVRELEAALHAALDARR